MGLLDGFEKLINEHGSAAILKERILLANDKYAILEQKVSVLEKQVSMLEAENERLKLDSEECQKQRWALEEKFTHVDSLSFDQSTGTYIDTNSPIRYCAVCRDGHNRKTPLRNDTHGRYCQICKRIFDDPSRPMPQITLGRPLV